MHPKGGEGERLLNPLISQRAGFCCCWDSHWNSASVYFTNPRQNITSDSFSARLNDGSGGVKDYSSGCF